MEKVILLFTCYNFNILFYHFSLAFYSINLLINTGSQNIFLDDLLSVYSVIKTFLEYFIFRIFF